MIANKILKQISPVVFCLILAGCNLSEPTQLSQERIQVQEHAFSDERLVSDVDEDYLSAVVDHYSKKGNGQIDMAVTYDPRSYRNTAMIAGQNAASIAENLREMGMRNVNVNVLPIKDQGDFSYFLISYDYYTASAPAGCTSMVGIDDQNVDPDTDYKLGCSVQMQIAKQVAHPSDLKGIENTDDMTDGRAAANIIEAYRTGATNKPLEGVNSTGE